MGISTGVEVRKVTDATSDRTGQADPVTEHLAGMLGEELESLMCALRDATERQWTASGAPASGEAGRGAGGSPADPTGAIAIDARRLALRETVTGAEAAVRAALVSARGARVALERAIARFDGERP